MEIFETERLFIRLLIRKDKEHFVELFSNPEIIDPIPKKRLDEDSINKIFSHQIESSPIIKRTNYWGVFEKKSIEPELIGLCLLLVNNNSDRELGYRFRKKYWNRGYGTELTRGVINFCFKNLEIEKITADVDVNNIKSIKILEKFLEPVSEFYNEKDNCFDRRYQLYRNQWAG